MAAKKGTKSLRREPLGRRSVSLFREKVRANLVVLHRLGVRQDALAFLSSFRRCNKIHPKASSSLNLDGSRLLCIDEFYFYRD